jgi:6-pyruvoyltetrahydropterin/6-carboxytetrahydropterin synthase
MDAPCVGPCKSQNPRASCPIHQECSLEIFKEFTFEAAHRLPNVPAGHKCSRLHGHSYRVELHVRGPIGERSGWLMDFSDLKIAFEPLLAKLDHYYLNEVEGLENPTSENLARWIWRRLRPSLPQLNRIVVRETCTSGCIYQGEDD